MTAIFSLQCVLGTYLPLPYSGQLFKLSKFFLYEMQWKTIAFSKSVDFHKGRFASKVKCPIFTNNGHVNVQKKVRNSQNS